MPNFICMYKEKTVSLKTEVGMVRPNTCKLLNFHYATFVIITCEVSLYIVT